MTPAPHLDGPRNEGGHEMRSRSSYRKLGGTAAAVVIALVAGTAASKGRPSGSRNPTGLEQCGTSPNPVTNGFGYTLVGANFPAGMGVTVYVADQVATWTYKGTVASNGMFSIAAMANFSSTGTKGIYVDRTGDRKFLTWCSSQFDLQ